MVMALEGLKVLDLTRSLSGPYCTMMLGDMGAEVVKVEIPGTGDETRSWGPPFIKGESSYFMSVNRNKKSITINLKTDEGKEILRRLIKISDIFIESFRPGTARDLGIDHQAVEKLNPRIIYCSISGFGQDGPYREKAGYDLVAQAMSGIMSITGERGRSPVKVGVAIADIGAGMFAAYGILSALYRREKTGEGQWIDSSLLDGQVAWLTYMGAYYLATGELPERLGTAHPSIVPYQAFKARDSYLVVAVGNDGIWARFCEALDILELAEDPRFRTNPDRVRNRDALVKILEDVFVRKPAKEWLDSLEKAGVPAGPLNNLDEVFTDPQVLHRKMLIEVEHSKAGRVKVTGVPVKLSKTPGAIYLPSPALGEHTDEILKSIGYTDREIAVFRARGVV